MLSRGLLFFLFGWHRLGRFSGSDLLLLQLGNNRRSLLRRPTFRSFTGNGFLYRRQPLGELFRRALRSFSDIGGERIVGDLSNDQHLFQTVQIRSRPKKEGV